MLYSVLVYMNVKWIKWKTHRLCLLAFSACNEFKLFQISLISGLKCICRILNGRCVVKLRSKNGMNEKCVQRIKRSWRNTIEIAIFCYHDNIYKSPNSYGVEIWANRSLHRLFSKHTLKIRFKLFQRIGVFSPFNLFSFRHCN